MTPAEWVAAARQAWRTRATATENKLRMALPSAPRIASVEEARAISMHFIRTIRRPTLDDVLILLAQIDDLLWEQESSGANILKKQLSERIAEVVRAETDLVEAHIELKQTKAALVEAHMELKQTKAALAAGLQLQLAMLNGRSAARQEAAATTISRRRAEALLNHLERGGPEGTNARLRLIEALCGDQA